MAEKMLHNRNFCKNWGKPGWVAQTLKSLSRETMPAKERPLEIQNPVGAFTYLLCQRYLKSSWNTCTCHKLISAAARKSNSVLACDDWQKLMNIFRLCRVFRVLFLRVQKYPILGKKRKRFCLHSILYHRGIPHLWKKHLRGKYTLKQAQFKGEQGACVGS